MPSCAHHHPAAATTWTPVPPGAIYTCPMHPEVRQTGPGPCPICGMALEPVAVSAAPERNHELEDFTRRFWIGLVLTLPLFLADMGAHLFGLHPPIPMGTMNWLEFALATPVVLWAGWPFFRRGGASVRSGHLNMFTLIATGTGAAWLFSTFALLFPAAIPATFRSHGEAPVYFEAAAVIVVLVLMGQLLELRARERTSGAIRALLNLSPRSALRVRPDGTDEEVGIGEIAVGDRLRVRPGEKIPVDGEVVEGRAAVDESLISGEPMPVTKVPGAKVSAGAINATGSLVMRAERVGADTLLARIVQMVAQAQRSRAPIQRLADRVAGWFVPAVIAAAALAFAAWSLAGPDPRLAHALVAAVSVLIIACPCALGLATPISIMVAVGRGAQAGVLIKDAEVLQRFEKVDTVVVDKTGTLTQGHPALTAVRLAPGFDRTLALRLAASVERSSEHPLAAAIVRAAAEEKIGLAEVSGFDSPVGRGVVGSVEGRTVVVGSAGLLNQHGIAVDALQPQADRVRADGGVAIFLGVDGRLAAVFAISDPIKPTARASVDALRRAGLQVVMLTGDNRLTAEAVAGALGIEEVHAEVLPEDKAGVVRALRDRGRVVAMAGDGVNDAPALAAADVGVAMGAGSDVAIESAGVTLLRGDLNGIVQARTLSRAAMGNIRQNLFFAFVYNAAGVPLAAGVLYPLTGWVLSPMIAALAMSLSSVSVIANALRLRSIRL